MSRFYSRLPTATYYAVRSWAGNFTRQIRLSRLQTRSKIAKTAAHEGRAARSISSVLRLIYNIKLTVILVNCKNCPIGCPYNLFLRFPPLRVGAGLSSLAFSVAPGWTPPNCFLNPLTHCQIMYRLVGYILYTYDSHHNFVLSPTVENFNPPAILSQFKHWTS